jgi:EmrB/QacA subfamily drug resistance transporter
LPWTPLRIRVTSGLLIAILVSAMDASVVSTAMPTIARELGGFPLYPWVFAGYLLTGTTTVPLWGRMADLFGRRRVLLAGLGWFVAASLLCGASPGMAWLVAFRTLQGVGAGCLQPVALTMVGDLFPVAQRARLQGLFSSAWAVAALVGPLLGALFVSTLGWRWIFDINLPIGIVATVLLWAHRDQPGRATRSGLDLVGAATLTLGVGAVLAGLGAGNQEAQPVWPLVVAGLALLVAFALVERRAAAPVMPVDLLRSRLVGPASLAAALAGGLMFAQSAFIPLYVQGGLGGSAFAAGAALTPGSVGWSAGAIFSGRVLLRVGYQRLAVAGAVAMVAGSMLLLLPPHWGPVWVGMAAGVVGIGMGLLQTPLLIVLQGSVGWGRRGAVTALNQFCRTIGGAIGVSLLGLLLEWRIRSAVGAVGVLSGAPLQPQGAITPAARRLLDAGLRGAVFPALAGVALATLFVALAILALRSEPESS